LRHNLRYASTMINTGLSGVTWNQGLESLLAVYISIVTIRLPACA
jgi:hypothetical protein